MFVKVGGFAHAWLDFIWFDVCITGLLTLAGHIFLLSDTSNVKAGFTANQGFEKGVFHMEWILRSKIFQKNQKILEERIAEFHCLDVFLLISFEHFNEFFCFVTQKYTSSFLSSHPTHIYIFIYTN